MTIIKLSYKYKLYIQAVHPSARQGWWFLNCGPGAAALWPIITTSALATRPC